MATCCVQLTDTISQLCCDDGSCSGSVLVELELISLYGGVLRDADTNDVVPTGIVWSTRDLDGTCSWTSCEIPTNAEICPPNDNLYRLHYTIDGVRYPPLNIYLDGLATPAICGTTVEVSEVALCGPVNPSSPLCAWIADCIDGGGGGGSFSCADLATCDISDIGDVSSTAPAIGQVLVWNGVSWAPDDQSGGGGSFSCTDLNTCSVTSLQDVSNSAPAIGQGLGWNGSQWAPTTFGTGGGGGDALTHVEYWTSALTLGSSPGGTPPSTLPQAFAFDYSTNQFTHWWNSTSSQWVQITFTETMTMTNIGPATVTTSGTQQGGWTAATDCTFRGGRFVWSDPELSATLPTNVTMGVFRSAPGSDVLVSSATLNSGAQSHTPVNFDSEFTVSAGQTVRWWFTSIGNEGSLDPQHTFSATFMKDQAVI